jgi:hypothetical protein
MDVDIRIPSLQRIVLTQVIPTTVRITEKCVFIARIVRKFRKIEERKKSMPLSGLKSIGNRVVGGLLKGAVDAAKPQTSRVSIPLYCQIKS